ncbi:peroxisome assembly protein 12-like [Ptychodera flava]|uniref:peroxisome assembly protein 12-like n=1 Tax=Ptychodera flava TaxID=63121 RepID=UPI00396A6E49
MAEFGAHLTSATAEDDKPTYFEVLAQEGLMSAIRPAMNYAFRVLAEQNPARYGWMSRFSNEIYLAIDLVLQQHFLTTTTASFSENFYGMKRVPNTCSSAPQVASPSGLPRREHLKSLLLLVIVPYLKIKLDALFERWKQEWLDGVGISQSERNTLKEVSRVYLAIYPYIHMGWEGAHLSYQLAYLFNKSRFHSPLIQLAGVRLQHLTREDMLEQMKPLESPFTQNASISERVKVFSKWLLGAVAIGVSNGLSVAVFFLQFLEWWYANESHRSAIALTALPVPDPPKKFKVESLPADSSICPLCFRKRTNDTAISTSGYVFCYPCIYMYVKSHKCCPITRYPTETEQLVKLYPPIS